MAAIKKCEKLFPKKDKAIYVLGSTSLNCLGSSLTQALVKTSPKGFSASKCDGGNWIHTFKILQFFWIFVGIFWGILFWRIFLEEFCEGFFGEDFFRRNFLGGDFESNSGRNYLVEIKKELMFLTRFWDKFVLMEGKRKKEEEKFYSLEVRRKLIALKKFSF